MLLIPFWNIAGTGHVWKVRALANRNLNVAGSSTSSCAVSIRIEHCHSCTVQPRKQKGEHGAAYPRHPHSCKPRISWRNGSKLIECAEILASSARRLKPSRLASGSSCSCIAKLVVQWWRRWESRSLSHVHHIITSAFPVAQCSNRTHARPTWGSTTALPPASSKPHGCPSKRNIEKGMPMVDQLKAWM